MKRHLGDCPRSVEIALLRGFGVRNSFLLVSGGVEGLIYPDEVFTFQFVASELQFVLDSTHFIFVSMTS